VVQERGITVLLKYFFIIFGICFSYFIIRAIPYYSTVQQVTHILAQEGCNKSFASPNSVLRPRNGSNFAKQDWERFFVSSN
jgi:hypothetical protein